MANQQNQDEMYFCYVPGELIFLIQHDEETSYSEETSLHDLIAPFIPDTFEALKGAFSNVDQEKQKPISFRRHLPPKWQTDEYQATHNAQPRFSLFFAKVGDEAFDTLVSGFYDLISPYAKENKGLGLPLSRESNPQTPYLTTVAPNWFMGAGQAHVPTGGPGGKPQQTNNMGMGFNVTSAQGLLNRVPGAQTAPGTVHVVVLDTVPPEQNLANAYASPAVPATHRLHQLLSSHTAAGAVPAGTQYQQVGAGQYRTADDAFSFQYVNTLPTGTAEFAKLEHFPPHNTPLTVKDHDYDMSDHGLFVASIVHALAEDAHIKLIQVLNDRGIGTFRTLVEGFQEILRWRATQPDPSCLIVNCSFTFTLPIHYTASLVTPKEISPTNVQFRWMDQVRRGLPEGIAGRLGSGTDFEDNYIPLLIQTICQVFDDKTMIVAAAGNESQASSAGQVRLPPGYPAALDFVTGVGALGSDLKPAPYSNIADEPEAQGIMAFGGDPDTLAGGKMVRGVYSNPNFPPPHAGANTTYMASWSGTSFATPVVSATLAFLCATRNIPPDQALTAIQGASTTDAVTGENDFVPIQN